MVAVSDEEPSREHWHIKKELTWGHLMTTALMAISLVGIYIDMNTRITDNSAGIAANREEIQHHREIVEEQRSQEERHIREIRDQMKEIREELREQRTETNRKLDRVLETIVAHQIMTNGQTRSDHLLDR